MPRIDKNIPLFQILKELKNYQRQIIIDHLDDESCSSLSSCIATVLLNGEKIRNKNEIKSCLKNNKCHFQKILSSHRKAKSRNIKKKASPFSKKRALARIGGNPLQLILSTAIPLLLELL